MEFESNNFVHLLLVVVVGFLADFVVSKAASSQRNLSGSSSSTKNKQKK
jgi:hypothetical protein